MLAKHSWDVDLIVIGGGSGGVRAARMAATRGGSPWQLRQPLSSAMAASAR